jgi:quaternary ammonium compound-resistance protein SugE
MNWIILILAGLFEVCWSLGLKYTNGFTSIVPTIFTAVTLIISMLLLSKAAESIPIGTAYPVWVGIGAIGAAVGGVILFKEEVTLVRVGFLCLLIFSIIGLKLTSGES